MSYPTDPLNIILQWFLEFSNCFISNDLFIYVSRKTSSLSWFVTWKWPFSSWFLPAELWQKLELDVFMTFNVCRVSMKGSIEIKYYYSWVSPLYTFFALWQGQLMCSLPLSLTHQHLRESWNLSGVSSGDLPSPACLLGSLSVGSTRESGSSTRSQKRGAKRSCWSVHITSCRLIQPSLFVTYVQSLSSWQLDI